MIGGTARVKAKHDNNESDGDDHETQSNSPQCGIVKFCWATAKKFKK
jgi:hypothetical protein